MYLCRFNSTAAIVVDYVKFCRRSLDVMSRSLYNRHVNAEEAASIPKTDSNPKSNLWTHSYRFGGMTTSSNIWKVLSPSWFSGPQPWLKLYLQPLLNAHGLSIPASVIPLFVSTMGPVEANWQAWKYREQLQVGHLHAHHPPLRDHLFSCPTIPPVPFPSGPCWPIQPRRRAWPCLPPFDLAADSPLFSLVAVPCFGFAELAATLCRPELAY